MSSKRVLVTLGMLTVVLLPPLSMAADVQYYDEVFNQTGAPRAAYSEILPIYQRLSPEQKKEFARISRKDFRGDNALDPLPRILTQSELQTLQKGVQQRGRAIQLFLRDYFAGNQEVVGKLIPKPVLERIVARSHDAAWVGLVDPDQIAFPYGPDIIRDPHGGWRVLEDNPGFIGGPGDLIHARETLMRRMSEYQNAIHPVNDPKQFYRDLVERYRSLRNPAEGRIVLYSVPPYVDREDRRLRKIFHELGVDIVGPTTAKRLTVDDSGVWINQGSGSKKSRQRVGFVILNGEHSFVDPTHSVAYERGLIEEARSHLSEKWQDPQVKEELGAALRPDPRNGKPNLEAIRQALRGSKFNNSMSHYKRTAAKGLNEAIIRGKVATNYTPGLDFIGDKEFYVYVEDLVRHYLNEEPVLKNIPTERFGIMDGAGKVTANRELLERVFSDPKRYVIKPVDGRGGDGVGVGPNIPAETFHEAKPKILAEPERFISQDFTHLSVAGDLIVDLRMISAIDRKGVYVSDTPWARALPLDGDGKVNVSSSGREMAVLVVPDQKAQPAATACVYQKLAESLSVDGGL